MAIARNLPVLAKKDKQDQVLCSLVEPVAAVIPSLSSSALIGLLQELQSSDGQLESILHNKFGVTLLYLILSEGERMQTLDPNCQLMEDNRWELLSIPSSSLSSPLFIPPNLQSLLSRYVDQQSLEYLHDKLHRGIPSLLSSASSTVTLCWTRWYNLVKRCLCGNPPAFALQCGCSHSGLTKQYISLFFLESSRWAAERHLLNLSFCTKVDSAGSPLVRPKRALPQRAEYRLSNW
ncbi:Protein PAT1 -like protein 1 PAT1-like protein 1 [Takifugu flavidus]|uniref:Protein PAT1-like protein 1 PAT1-like protein 1 n=1 Tax=Takifugu flavidus TaxID=433684 RepID=A0A5C6MW38_9TELE|nr:Protein PAT1 -like protein 1 PAT1-like protein 1 [Takifugu flavidus]